MTRPEKSKIFSSTPGFPPLQKIQVLGSQTHLLLTPNGYTQRTEERDVLTIFPLKLT